MSSDGKRSHVGLLARALTLHEDLGDFGVTGAESTVDLKTIRVVEEGAAQREEDFLREREHSYQTGTRPGAHGCLGVFFPAIP